MKFSDSYLVTCVTAVQLSDTKASDRKMTLLHFIVKTVREKFPDVATFDTELKYVEKAATGSADFLQVIYWQSIPCKKIDKKINSMHMCDSLCH